MATLPSNSPTDVETAIARTEKGQEVTFSDSRRASGGGSGGHGMPNAPA